MDLAKIDLNLFTVFDAIYKEGGITAASKRLHLSQPAVSHALARLRELLDDPLFERHGNEMIITPRAQEVAATIGGSLESIEQLLQRIAHFEPQTSQRAFTISMRESHEANFLPAMWSIMECSAPHVTVAAVRMERRDLEDDLQTGSIDCAIDMALPLSNAIRRELLMSEPPVVLARKNHPAIQGQLDLATYLAQDHVLITGRRRGGGFEDAALSRSGLSRRIRMRCQQHAAANDVVSKTNLLATMPQSYAEQVNRYTGNQMLPFPIESLELELFMYWHSNVDNDAANRWFRETVRDVLKAKRAGSPDAS